MDNLAYDVACFIKNPEVTKGKKAIWPMESPIFSESGQKYKTPITFEHALKK